MSDFAYLETDVSEKIRIALPDGRVVGKLLSGFLLAMLNFLTISNPDKEIKNWFQLLKNQTPDITPFSNIWYGGEWDYSEDDYEKFLNDAPQMQIPKEEFLSIIRQVKTKWSDVDIIYDIVKSLNLLLSKNSFPPTWFYIPGETEKELKALENALLKAKHIGAKKIRIQFI